MSIPQVYLYNSFAEWANITNSIATEIGDLSLFTGQNIGTVDLTHTLNNLDNLKYNKAGGAISGAVTIGTTLGVTGATTLTALLTANGNITLGSNLITLSSSTGSATFAGTLSVNGTSTMAAVSANTLSVTGNATLNSNLTVIGSATPATIYLKVSNGTTNTFSVDSANGNTALSGTCSITGALTLASTVNSTLQQYILTSNLVRSIVTNAAEPRQLREYQDIPDALSGTQGFDASSITEFGSTFNARWDQPTSLYVKDRALAGDHASSNRLSKDLKQQWWFSDGTSANSTIAWVKKVEFNLPSSTYTFNGAMNVSGTLTAGNTTTTGSVSVGSATSFADVNVTTITTSSTPLSTIDTTVYRSATFDIQAYDSTSGKYSKATISAIHNGTLVDYVEYGAVAVLGVCGTYSVSLSGTSLFLNVVPASANSTTFKVHATLIKI